MALVDELQAGGPFLATEDLRLETGAGATVLALALFTGPMLLGVLIDPLLLVWSQRFDRRRVLAGALLVMAGCPLLVATASAPWTLALALGAWGLSAGLATSAAEVALVAAAPGEGEEVMSRWARYGALGDLLAPLLYTATAALGLGWRPALALGSLVAAGNAWLAWTSPLPSPAADEEEEEVPLRDAIRQTLGAPAVWAWLLAATACTLFDEVFVSFGTLHLRQQGASAAAQGLAIGLGAFGAALGTLVTERALRRQRPSTVLLACCGACVLAFPLWLHAPPAVAGPLTLLLGATTLPMWAIATARAYASAPRPALVAALSALLVPLELLPPAAIGAVADAVDLRAGLLLLLAQPLVVGLVAAWSRRRGA